MPLSRRLRLRWPAILSAAAIAAAVATSKLAVVASTTPALDVMNEAMLTDLIESYVSHEPSQCASSSEAATTISFDWPGFNPASKWAHGIEQYERAKFQAIMSHNDEGGKRSWSIRFGTAGDIYSHFAKDMHGEAWPPQDHHDAPWIDEVQQTISVNINLNKRNIAEYCPGFPNTSDKTRCKWYFLHQAGIYQQDAPYTDEPFFSPTLARHCSGNSCYFATWGTQAHVSTPFTSPVLYFNKYTNCDNGVIEHTQMVHNFANPSDPLSTPFNTDQTYLNVGWGGIRTSNLPKVLEPDPATGSLKYTNKDDLDFIPLCQWGSLWKDKTGVNRGHDFPGGPAGRGIFRELKELGGYTTFVDNGLLMNVNAHVAPWKPWCRKGSDPTCTNPATCMVRSCTDDQVRRQGYTRVELKVYAFEGPDCIEHSRYEGKVVLQCKMRDANFGRTWVYSSLYDDCTPWSRIGFRNAVTKKVLNVFRFQHYSWSNGSDRRVIFAVYETNAAKAIRVVNSMFDNTRRGRSLSIDVVETTSINSARPPANYNPGALNAFTHVYGKGAEYGNGINGKARRRIGFSPRDYAVFTINWIGLLRAGGTYANRAFYVISDLASVKTTAEDLTEKTYAEEINLELWSPRAIDIYQSGSNIAVLAATEAKGTSTKCYVEPTPTLACSGYSTPKTGHVPFFYVTCGASTYFGPNPYHFTPAFGARFPSHGNIDNLVRSYLCDGQDMSVRPTWKMIGFFNPTNAGCASLSSALYDESAFVCPTSQRAATKAPSDSPTSKPTQMASAAPTSKPTKMASAAPSSSPSQEPSAAPSSSPSQQPSASSIPSQQPSATPSSIPSQQPSDVPSSIPSQEPSVVPSSSPSGESSAAPTHSPTEDPSAAPTYSPTEGPSADPTYSLTQEPSADPTYSPTQEPSADPTYSPTQEPSADPTYSPTEDPSTDPTYSPTEGPNADTTFSPTEDPSADPTFSPTEDPSADPTSYAPTKEPNVALISSSTSNPTEAPSAVPTYLPTRFPTAPPTKPNIKNTTLRPFSNQINAKLEFFFNQEKDGGTPPPTLGADSEGSEESSESRGRGRTGKRGRTRKRGPTEIADNAETSDEEEKAKTDNFSKRTRAHAVLYCRPRKNTGQKIECDSKNFRIYLGDAPESEETKTDQPIRNQARGSGDRVNFRINLGDAPESEETKKDPVRARGSGDRANSRRYRGDSVEPEEKKTDQHIRNQARGSGDRANFRKYRGDSVESEEKKTDQPIRAQARGSSDGVNFQRYRGDSRGSEQKKTDQPIRAQARGSGDGVNFRRHRGGSVESEETERVRPIRARAHGSSH